MVDKLNAKVVDIRVLLWVASSVITLVITLTGVVYSNLKDRINTKADQAAVTYMQNDITEMKGDIKDLLKKVR